MRERPAKTIVVLGSGGHTAEMLEIVKHLDKTKYTPRCYIIADSDVTSRNRVKQLEENISDRSYELYNISRSRAVKQSYITSILTTIMALLSAIPLVYKLQPDLVLCNGPGTCVPICIIAFILKMLHLIPKDCKIVFLESYCRVKTLSLSGKILKYFVDLFVVQWPQLQSKQTQYIGKIM